MSRQATRIVLVRHGQTAWNREVRFRGRADPELDEIGLRQAAATARYYVADRWTLRAVYTSPMARAEQTARAIAEVHGLQTQPFEGLLDIDFGDWQGRSPNEVRSTHPDLLRRWYAAPHTVQFPGGEGLDDVRHRALGGLDAVLEMHTGQTVAMVGHNVVNRLLLCAVMGLGNEHFWRLRQDTCAVSVLEVDEDGNRTVVSLNDTCHLRNLEERAPSRVSPQPT